jgi:RNA polymerase sigma-70 factor (ECF subfamily)
MEVGAIYSEFHNSLLVYIRSKVRSKEDAEDILQNVFIKISSHINSLSDEKKLASWIYTVARNTITDYYRTNGSKRMDSLDERAAMHLPDENTEDNTKGLDQCLLGMIEALPEEYRAIMYDAELKGIKQKDLAQKYNLAYPTIRSRVQRGRERLKQLLTNCCNIETDKHGNILDVSKKFDCDDSNNPCPK